MWSAAAAAAADGDDDDNDDDDDGPSLMAMMILAVVVVMRRMKIKRKKRTIGPEWTAGWSLLPRQDAVSAKFEDTSCESGNLNRKRDPWSYRDVSVES